MRQKVIVLGSNYSSLLGMIRCVGLAGHEVIVVKSYMNEKIKKREIESKSKYVSRYLFIKDADREGLTNLLINEFGDITPKPILIPIMDDMLMSIDLYYDKLKQHFHLPNINNKAGNIIQLMNKSFQKELAQKKGLKIAKEWIIQIDNKNYSIPKDIEYPCFPKAQTSVYGGKTFMKKIESQEDLQVLLNEISERWKFCTVLIEEFINIEKEYATVGLCINDKVYLPEVIELKEQGSGVHKGVCMQGNVYPFSKFHDLEVLFVNFMKGLNFIGLFDIDFYYANGQYYFNELNLRSGASGYSLIHYNINLPQILINYYQTGDLPPSPSFNSQYSFFSEKVAFEAYLSGYINWQKYKDLKNKSDFYLIQSKDDIVPYISFKQKIFISLIKRCMKFILTKHKRI